MIQEIITYMIIGAALAYTFSGVWKKIVRKKGKPAKTNFKGQNFTFQHNCSDCSAECMLRSSVKKTLSDSNTELCRKIEIKQRL